MSEGPSSEQASQAFATFLEESPPGTIAAIAEIGTRDRAHSVPYLSSPDVQLHCTSETCNGKRIFECSDHVFLPRELTPVFLGYVCRNCRTSRKLYALSIEPAEHTFGSIGGRVVKIGESPPFGPPVPSRVISLIGPDRDLFLKGRSAENSGLGIGAFAYYRRVVENQKDRLLDEIIRLATKVSRQMVPLLEKAKAETQFSKAMEMTKDAIPQALLIDGNNPLLLLHRALSEGLHDLTDSECMELAQDTRVVLYELAERLGVALQDHAELKTAIHRLQKKRGS